MIIQQSNLPADVAGTAPETLPGPMRTRSRRTCHVVPGSSEAFLAKAPGLDADQTSTFEDAVAPAEKERARARVADVLRTADLGGRPEVRANVTDSAHRYRDVIAIAESAATGWTPSCS